MSDDTCAQLRRVALGGAERAAPKGGGRSGGAVLWSSGGVVGVGVLTHIPLWLGLGRPGPGGPAH